MVKWINTAIAVCLISACGGDGGCEPYIPQTAEIKIYDAITGLPIGCGTTVTVGTWTETYPDTDHCDDELSINPHLGAGEFEVLITKPGYEDWSTHINVPALNRCATLTEPAMVEAFLASE